MNGSMVSDPIFSGMPISSLALFIRYLFDQCRRPERSLRYMAPSGYALRRIPTELNDQAAIKKGLRMTRRPFLFVSIDPPRIEFYNRSC